MGTVGIILLLCIAALVIFYILSRARSNVQRNENIQIRLVSFMIAAKRALCLGSVVMRACIYEGAIDVARSQSDDAQKTVKDTLNGKYPQIIEWLKS